MTRSTTTTTTTTTTMTTLCCFVKPQLNCLPSRLNDDLGVEEEVEAEDEEDSEDFRKEEGGEPEGEEAA